jgi:hypothetical protein
MCILVLVSRSIFLQYGLRKQIEKLVCLIEFDSPTQRRVKDCMNNFSYNILDDYGEMMERMWNYFEKI